MKNRVSPAFWVAGTYVVVGATLETLGSHVAASIFAGAAATATVIACVLQVVSNKRERKSNGRHRKALEAHRAGTCGGSGDSSCTCPGGSALRAGASANPYDAVYRDIEKKMREMGLAGAVSAVASTPQQPAPTPARTAGQFDGVTADFAAGMVTGTRSFDVDKLGRLTGVAYPAVWKPGENVARCMYMRAASFGVLGYSTSTSAYESQLVESGRQPHSIAECGHGFYGYYEGSNDYYHEGRVMGVVEAYGETVIGTRGFRASKARIVALHMPSELSQAARKLVARNYGGIPLFESFDAMVSEFPPDDAGYGLSPDTDPEFWTRKA